MATTITKPETLVGKRIRRQRRSAPDHRHRHLRGRHQDARHASRLHRAQPARAPPGSSASTPKPRSERPGVVAVFTGADVKDRRPGALRRLAARPARAAPLICWPRTASTSSAIPWPWWSPRTATSPPTPPTWSKWNTSHCQAVADPEKALAPGAPAVHPEWPDNIAFTFHQEGGDTEQGLPRSRGRRQAAHHQPAPDPHRHGNARRGGRVARRRKDPDPVLLHPDPAPAAHAGGRHPGHARESPARDHARSRRRLRRQAQRLRRRGADGLRRHAASASP